MTNVVLVVFSCIPLSQAKAFHSMAPFLAMAKLERVLFALGLPKELFHVVYLLAELLKGDSHVREGDDAGRVSPFATSIGMIAALTKDKYAAVALNNVNNGGG